MSAKNFRPWTRRVASALVLSATATAASPAADDVFVEQGVIVRPIPKWKQRQLEKRVLRRPGSQVVIEGKPAAVPAPEVLSSVRTRRAFRPMFPGLFDRRNEILVGPSVVSTPGTVVAGPSTITSRPVVTNGRPAPGAIVSTPRSTLAPGDPLVLPGSAEESVTPRVVRPPVIPAPRATTPPPVDEPDLKPERPAATRGLPAPAEEIPPPVVSTPRPGLNPATPAPTPAPVPDSIPAPTLPSTPAPEPVDPGPPPATPSPAPAPTPAAEPTSAPAEPRLDPPQPASKPA